jgi:hypothetical protein
MRVHRLLLGTTAALTLYAGVAHGQTDPRVEQARQHFNRGVELISQARWNDAIRELQAARAERPTPPVMFNLGLAQRAVGREREAIASFRQFIQLAGPGIDPARRAEAERYINELTPSLAHLHLRRSPRDAEVTVDDERVPAGVSTLEVDPGRHHVRATAPGYAEEVDDVTLEPGGESTLGLNLVRTNDRGHVRIETDVAGAIIRVDGRMRGETTVDEDMGPGHHVVDVTARGYQSFHREFDLAVGGQQRVSARLVRESTSVAASPWFWLGAAVVVAGATVGGVFLFSHTQDPYSGGFGTVSTGLEVRR